MMKKTKLINACTTYPSKRTAESSSKRLLDLELIVCAQIEGPIQSSYHWNGMIENEEEWKLTIKLLPNNLISVEKMVTCEHPYELPQWTYSEVLASDEYYSWAQKPKGK